jgi:transaldolase
MDSQKAAFYWTFNGIVKILIYWTAGGQNKEATVFRFAAGMHIFDLVESADRVHSESVDVFWRRHPFALSVSEDGLKPFLRTCRGGIMKKDNPIRAIRGFGQSVWLDYIRRGMIVEGELQQLMAQDGLRGLTSNPSIFEQVIASSGDYEKDIRLIARQGRSVEDIHDSLTFKDIGMAADMFRPLYEQTDGAHGYVGLEIDPHLAYDEEKTLQEARRLWRALERPNLMLKVPATNEGVSSMRQLIREGINVNTTLLFGLPRYRQAAQAYIEGLEARAADGRPVSWVGSVASFFISRIDVMIDDILKHREHLPEAAARVDQVYGQTGIASAKLVYQIYKEIFESDRFGALRDKGAHPQRLLWASTSTKSGEFSDIKYVEALIGPDTISAMSLETLNGYRDHGEPKLRLTQDLRGARQVMDSLPILDINIEKVTQSLEEQGVERFIQAYDRLMHTIEKARYAAL